MFGEKEEQIIRAKLLKSLAAVVDDLSCDGDVDMGYFPEDAERSLVDACMVVLRHQRAINEYHKSESTKFD